mmetsp:Transcript_54379/g.69899  ORF Transcript_54379/g.69899 Transcript_54379/m.69899 type:complete len:205 (-) Transcript_54379:323-937(-)
MWNELIEDVVERVADAPPTLQAFIYNLSSYGNVPRNQKKFTNFAKNSLNIRSDKVVDELWSYLSIKQQENKTVGEQESEVKHEEIIKTKRENDDDNNNGDENHNNHKKQKKEKKDIKSSISKTETTTLPSEEDWIKKIKKCLKSSSNQSLPVKTLRNDVIKALELTEEVMSKNDQKSMLKKTILKISKITKSGNGSDAIYTYKK